MAGGWRLLALAAVAAAVLAAPATPARVGGTSASGVTAAERGIRAANDLEGGVLAEINALRQRHGLARLRTSPRLRAAADSHSGAMARFGFFKHDSRDGSAFWRRIERFYDSKRYRYWAVGENLLWSAPDLDPARAIRMWLDSPTHRKVLLAPRWRHVGLSAVHVDAAPGVFGGREVTIVTADFGVRR